MDSLCLKAGIHGMGPPNAVTASAGGCLDIRASHVAQMRATAVGRSSSAAAGTSMSMEKPPSPSPPPQPQRKNSAWGFSFRYPLRSLWPGGKNNRYDAMAAADAVSVEDEGKLQLLEEETQGRNGNWVLKILHVKSLWKEEEESKKIDNENENARGVKLEKEEEEEEEDDVAVNGNGCDEECQGCRVDDDDDDGGENIEFDRESFSKLLKRVSLAEARLYAQMSYLGDLAYAIPQIKPKNLLRHHGLRFVTSSLEKKEQAVQAEREKALAEGQQPEKEKASAEAQEIDGDKTAKAADEDEKSNGAKISSSAAYEIAASAASYLHSYTKSILPRRSSKSMLDESLPERTSGSSDNANMTHEEVASFMATTDSVTAVVAAKEEVKQAVADDLSSTHSSPCEWFICDDDQSATRYFVIQGSESLASWQANLLFEPIKFEGLDVLVHRGIYEAAKGIYEQMLPEVRAHLKVHGSCASFRFTGHSLGGSLSLLVNLMLLIREEVPPSSLLPVITFGAPAVMCGGDHLLRQLGLPRSHLQSITMHRDIVPRAFSCNYPNHVAEFLKAVNGNFRNHPCLNNQKLLYAPMGEFLILQPDEKFSPHHHLLPSGSGLYLLRYPAPDGNEADKQIRAAQTVFLNSPHPLEILSDRSAYGTGGSIQRDHDMNSYLKSIRNVIRQELNSIRRTRRQQRRKVWLPLVAPRGVNAGIIVGRPVVSGNMGQGQCNFSGILQNGKESFKRFSRLVASQHMHLLVVLLFPARLLILGTYSIINCP